MDECLNAMDFANSEQVGGRFDVVGFIEFSRSPYTRHCGSVNDGIHTLACSCTAFEIGCRTAYAGHPQRGEVWVDVASEPANTKTVFKQFFADGPTEKSSVARDKYCC
jgi:hypothetical protein